MNYIEVEKNTLGEIRKEAMEIASQWNGEDSGLEEERAEKAQDILEAIQNLGELISEL
jgi:phage host-nuclease inhibitor protein Gam